MATSNEQIKLYLLLLLLCGVVMGLNIQQIFPPCRHTSHLCGVVASIYRERITCHICDVCMTHTIREEQIYLINDYLSGL